MGPEDPWPSSISYSSYALNCRKKLNCSAAQKRLELMHFHFSPNRSLALKKSLLKIPKQKPGPGCWKFELHFAKRSNLRIEKYESGWPFISAYSMSIPTFHPNRTLLNISFQSFSWKLSKGKFNMSGTQALKQNHTTDKARKVPIQLSY